MGEQVGDKLSDLLRAVFNRLTNAKLSGLKQDLIMVFCRLVHVRQNDTVAFLSQLATPDGTSALQVLLSLWVKCHRDFTGAFQTKLSLMALTRLAYDPNAEQAR